MWIMGFDVSLTIQDVAYCSPCSSSKKQHVLLRR